VPHSERARTDESRAGVRMSAASAAEPLAVATIRIQVANAWAITMATAALRLRLVRLARWVSRRSSIVVTTRSLDGERVRVVAIDPAARRHQ